MIAWIKLDPPCWGNALNLAADCLLLTQHLSWEGLVRSLVWKASKLQTLSRIAFQARKGDWIVSWRAVQAEAHVNPYSGVSRLEFLLLHPLTFFFFSIQPDWWQLKKKRWVLAFATQRVHTHTSYSLAAASVCRTYWPVQMIGGEWGFFYVHSVASTVCLYMICPIPSLKAVPLTSQLTNNGRV